MTAIEMLLKDIEDGSVVIVNTDKGVFVSDLDKYTSHEQEMLKKSFALGIEYSEDKPNMVDEKELTGRYFESKAIERRFYFFANPKL